MSCYNGYVPKDATLSSLQTHQSQQGSTSVRCLKADRIIANEIVSDSISSRAACIRNETDDNSVCVDDDNIVFTMNGITRAQINSNGTFMVGTTSPTIGKIAHFEGDIKVTGIIDPIALQTEQTSVVPVDPTSTTTGVLWVRDDSPNVLVYTDNGGTSHDISNGINSSVPPDWTPTELSIIGSVPFTSLLQGSGSFTNISAIGDLSGAVITCATNSCLFDVIEQYLAFRIPAGLVDGTVIYITFGNFSGFPPSIALGMTINVAGGIYNCTLNALVGAVGVPVGPVTILATDELALSIRDTGGSTAQLNLFQNGTNVLTFNPTSLVGTPNNVGIYYGAISGSVTITKPLVPLFPIVGLTLYSAINNSGTIDPASYPANRLKKTFSITGLSDPLGSDVGIINNGNLFIFDDAGNPLSKEYRNIRYLDSVTSDIQNQFNNLVAQNYLLPADIGVTVQPFIKNNLVALVAPTNIDDSAQGYSRGSIWIRNFDNSVYMCADASIGSAQWSLLSTQTAILDRYRMVILAGAGGTQFNSPSISPVNGPYFLLTTTTSNIFDGWQFSDNTPGAQSWVTIGTKGSGIIYLWAVTGSWWTFVAGTLTDTGSAQYVTGNEGSSYHLYYNGTIMIIEQTSLVGM